MLIHKIRESGVFLLGLFISGGAAALASPLEETVNVLEQWVETERQISETRANWEQERAAMQDLISIYKVESEQLDKVIDEASEELSAAEARRSELLQREEQLKSLENQVLAKLIDTEVAVKGLESKLPSPLQEELRPLFRGLPENPAESRLAIGQRIQPIVAILTQVQKFNQSVTIAEGFRDFEAGKTVQTEKVYFGLGTSYYVDGGNEHAGLGVLTAEGWRWEDDNTLVPLVRQFVEIYRGTRQASYLPMPVQVK